MKGNIDGHQCEICEKTGLPRGMKEGTTAENFRANCGGWNCGHELIPIPEAMAPQEIREKLKNSATFAGNMSNRKIKKLEEFEGSLQEFADEVLSSKHTSDVVKQLGRIDNTIIKDMKQKGVDLQSDSVFITDRKILKYLNHPKEKKGAVIDPKRYAKIEQLVKNPLNIYEDINSNTLVYVYTSDYDQKVLKAIIHPNYTLNGNVINLLKSIGVVERRQLDNINIFRKIK
ncbi:MAG: hypothetical protein LBR08_00755 [Bacteroidales bacterium]|nr:hypothetical protein [Bacteroidales bacterium]